MQQNSEMDYVGFWPRVGATLIDTILMLIIIIPMLMAIYGQSYFLTDSFFRGPAHFMISCVLPPLIQLALWITLSTTPGKMAIGAIIVDARTGNKPSAGQCIKRCLSAYLSALPLYLGFFWIAIDPRKQGWHDKIAGTVVIRRKATAVPAALDLPLQ
ncbi:hypothetical protein NC77_25965 [Janthinobacterium lividum]|uniref:RDD family protein n=1 Tax=Janthinobacterium lividum TaxID=29581 RepID=UPI00053696BE|nr:RDD family protein [Janthinobacterium lividum]KHA75920.1 hypothetical protein NC77_25965 [Janthinobacterium lividum]